MYLMSDIYAVEANNYNLIREIDESYETPNHYVRFTALHMGKIATSYTVEDSDSVKIDKQFHTDNEETVNEIKYLPTTRPNLVRQRISEATDKVVLTEAEQRSFGFCFVGKSTEQQRALLIVPRSISKQALLEVFDRDEI